MRRGQRQCSREEPRCHELDFASSAPPSRTYALSTAAAISKRVTGTSRRSVGTSPTGCDFHSMGSPNRPCRSDSCSGRCGTPSAAGCSARSCSRGQCRPVAQRCRRLSLRPAVMRLPPLSDSSTLSPVSRPTKDRFIDAPLFGALWTATPSRTVAVEPLFTSPRRVSSSRSDVTNEQPLAMICLCGRRSDRSKRRPSRPRGESLFDIAEQLGVRDSHIVPRQRQVPRMSGGNHPWHGRADGPDRGRSPFGRLVPARLPGACALPATALARSTATLRRGAIHVCDPAMTAGGTGDPPPLATRQVRPQWPN